jgi:hypothetical protein
LEALVAGGRFDEANWRHRRELDESGPFADRELELRQRHVLDLRGGFGGRVRAAEAVREFGRFVRERRRG